MSYFECKIIIFVLTGCGKIMCLVGYFLGWDSVIGRQGLVASQLIHLFSSSDQSLIRRNLAWYYCICIFEWVSLSNPSVSGVFQQGESIYALKMQFENKNNCKFTYGKHTQKQLHYNFTRVFSVNRCILDRSRHPSFVVCIVEFVFF